MKANSSTIYINKNQNKLTLKTKQNKISFTGAWLIVRVAGDLVIRADDSTLFKLCRCCLLYGYGD